MLLKKKKTQIDPNFFFRKFQVFFFFFFLIGEIPSLHLQLLWSTPKVLVLFNKVFIKCFDLNICYSLVPEQLIIGKSSQSSTHAPQCTSLCYSFGVPLDENRSNQVCSIPLVTSSIFIYFLKRSYILTSYIYLIGA